MKFLFFVFMIPLLLSACSTPAPQWSGERPYPITKKPEVGDIVHLPTGIQVSEEQMLTNTALTPVVYVGEVHDNPASHRLELKVLKSMHKSHPGDVVLGMEMFTHSQQPVLDRWIAGELTEREFLKESDWFGEGWGSDFAYYRSLLEYCRDEGIPVLALNVNKDIGRKVSMTPLDKLDSEIKGQIPEMDMTDPYQRSMIESIFAAHGAGGSKMVESFFRRQTLWDETMAETAADYLNENSGKRMLIIAGGWHVEYSFGVPRRLFSRYPVAYTTISSENLHIPEVKRAQMMDVDLPEYPMPEADYLVFHDYEILPTSGVKLGVLLEEREDKRGVDVTGMLPGSDAEVAGIKKGDTMIKYGDLSITDNFDVVYSVKQQKVGDRVMLLIGREGKESEVEVIFSKPKSLH